jgi:solute carrier family 25 oxoglutarate transporter 11
MSDYRLPPVVVSFTTAGLGGIAGWLIVHPFNTCSVRMNLATSSSNSSSSSLPFRKFLMNSISKDGILSLYSGLSAGILRQVFYSTSRFGLFELFRDELAKYRPTDMTSRMATGILITLNLMIINIVISIISLSKGILSGGIAALISSPAEVTLVRISNDISLPLDKRRNYKGVVDAFTRILREEGTGAFFRGSGPFINRAMLVGAVQVGTYDQFRESFRSIGITAQFTNVFCASMASGIIYSSVTMPFETAKNRMAFQKKDANGVFPYRSAIQTMSTIASNEGIMKLWSGFSPYYIRCGGHTVVMFVTIEYLRKIINGK